MNVLSVEELSALAERARFLVIGSASVQLQRPDLLRRAPADTDLLVEPLDVLGSHANPVSAVPDGGVALLQRCPSIASSSRLATDARSSPIAAHHGCRAHPALESLAGALVGLGFTLTSWREPVTLPLDLEALAGRWYLRAERGHQLVDVTYECPWLVFAEAWARRVPHRGVPLAHLVDVAALIAARDEPTDAEYAARLVEASPPPTQ